MDTYAGLFYGYHYTTSLTFKKSLLLYDEVHFLDRPAFTMKGKFGTIGEKSPFRRIPPELEKEDVKIICHSPPSGWISEPLRASIAEDMRDERFARTFIKRFFEHEFFYGFFLQPKGKYSQIKDKRGKDFSVTGEEIKEAMSRIDWSTVRFDFERLESVKDGSFLYSIETKENQELTMNWFLCEASYLLNCFMISTIEIDAVPFTDIRPYHELLLIKYARAKESGAFKLPIITKISYIAHTILDDIFVSESFKKRETKDILKFRKRHVEELKIFRQYLAKLQHNIESEVFTPKFEEEVSKLINLEVLPKVKELRECLKKSWIDLFGSLIKKVSATELTALAMIILKGMPLDTLV